MCYFSSNPNFLHTLCPIMQQVVPLVQSAYGIFLIWPPKKKTTTRKVLRKRQENLHPSQLRTGWGKGENTNKKQIAIHHHQCFALLCLFARCLENETKSIPLSRKSSNLPPPTTGSDATVSRLETQRRCLPFAQWPLYCRPRRYIIIRSHESFHSHVLVILYIFFFLFFFFFFFSENISFWGETRGIAQMALRASLAR
ncbi:uncharacterized protein F4812DRAFT_47578 [Daldinia caldariorum]|uniref:uncharacterized protein n=1 Tax=Daldinia caldariorum TaxID=326644 RepID=UPI0020077C8B|nr:uncharacterized protein F4812DRAFT_47578 [Daldinia caldariorum]KAI1467065.1 hypothetical protein F4812DRAFT_47578 [Daldinia caldariorum]